MLTSLARAYWPNADPIGKRLKQGDAGSKAPWLTVVGVVGNVKQYALDTDSRVVLKMPHLQIPLTIWRGRPHDGRSVQRGRRRDA